MPEMNGMEVLQQKRSSILPALIFTTAFDEYAIPAFDFEAIDYLLKPFDKERFDKAVEKAIRYICFSKEAGTKSFADKLNVKIGSKTHIISLKQVEYFHSEGAYIKAIY